MKPSTASAALSFAGLLILLLLAERTTSDHLADWARSFSLLDSHLVKRVPSEDFGANMAELRRLDRSRLAFFQPNVRRAARALMKLNDFENCDLELAGQLNVADISLGHIVGKRRIGSLFKVVGASALAKCRQQLERLHEAALSKVHPEDLKLLRQAADHQFLDRFEATDQSKAGELLEGLVVGLLERSPSYRRAQTTSVRVRGHWDEALFKETVKRRLLWPCVSFFRATEDMWRVQELLDSQQVSRGRARSEEREDDLRRARFCAKIYPSHEQLLAEMGRSRVVRSLDRPN